MVEAITRDAVRMLPVAGTRTMRAKKGDRVT